MGADGFIAGPHLEQVTHILPLAHLPAKLATLRYGILAHRFSTHGSPYWQRNYEAVAILGLLDWDPSIISRISVPSSTTRS